MPVMDFRICQPYQNTFDQIQVMKKLCLLSDISLLCWITVVHQLAASNESDMELERKL